MNNKLGVISDNDSNIQILKSFISDFISSLSSKSFSLGLGLMLLDQTHSAMSFGINMIISPLVSLVFLIPIGNLVDRFQHKKILLANILIRVVALIIFLLSLSVFSGKSIILSTFVFVMINAITVNIYTSLVIGVPFIIKQQFHFGNTTVGLLETASAFGSLSVGIVALSLVVLNIIVQAYLQTIIPTKFLGRVMGTLFAANTSIMPIGTLIFTYVFQNMSSGGIIFIFSGVILFIYTLLLLPKIRPLL